ncbi:MAG: hypothetical protein M3Y91_17035 [Actinomycetota bacterium]|nr:hypothetical protein [Actinomycetota bacterium]
MLSVVDEDLDQEMERRLDEHADDVARFKAGDPTAFEDLLEACTGAKVRSVTVRRLANE